ncbi:DUF4823 domain-containing protein [Pseudomonas sp. ABC1]|uniref:DUF4823 domain-containing protein n=1 Tax=Pseudomonas sp. ABC1 TaxID=2748080 RepID=UPI0015C40B2E|nr:DUF4823 domain-containing protein [Pseudomonas sp. ABC1]QLF93014.1 DUF4823 domain-containing protein [Pseudomonas sp. ABC1]
MRILVASLLLMALGGCMKVSDMAEGSREQLRDAGILDHSDVRRASPWRLQPDSFIYIAQGYFSPVGNTQPRPNLLAEQAFNGFVEYFPRLRRAQAPLGLEEAMAEARSFGAHYLLYTRFASADDRIGTLEEWDDQRDVSRLGFDSGNIQMMLLETNTHYLVDTAHIRIRSGLLTSYDSKPQELLGPPFKDYAKRLLGVGR